MSVKMRLIIVSGLSGSGKSVALHVLEDLGYYCIDNMPAALLKALTDEVIQDVEQAGSRIAVSIDSRNRISDLEALPALLSDLHENSVQTDLLFLQYIIFIFVIAGMVQLVEMYVRKFAPALYKALGVYLPLITTNCAILFACLTIAKDAKLTDSFLMSLVYSFFGGIGFTMAIVLMAGVREELESADIPEPLKGPGITLVTAGLMALAFMGFKGMAG